jgi:hypothetical protein
VSTPQNIELFIIHMKNGMKTIQAHYFIISNFTFKVHVIIHIVHGSFIKYFADFEQKYFKFNTYYEYLLHDAHHQSQGRKLSLSENIHVYYSKNHFITLYT